MAIKEILRFITVRLPNVARDSKCAQFNLSTTELGPGSRRSDYIIILHILVFGLAGRFQPAPSRSAW